MRQARIIASLFLVLFFASAVAWRAEYVARRRAVRSEILQAYSSVLTVVDYQGAGEFALAQADIAAREKLSALDSERLPPDSERVVLCIEHFLGSVESLDSSESIETAKVRTPIAEKAADDAAACVKQLQR